jgi:hypothetical protein
VAGLNSPAIREEQRAAPERAIKCQLTDLSALAEFVALAPQHPLRAGATVHLDAGIP